ncbi:NUDIX domain-containing protein [Streptomyces sp. SID8366]|uniref:NUDIX hydrolase n=1 Tax=unclassified Streptomyces TaxID=2593676 RepID=UPI000DB96725|nr:MULTISPECIES: NUDIX hydrolase [unclassified Streptomyces]MYU04806.1 NUDIX domain-containing protein [Streptomyces sp. SID8366]MYU67380.1 NUDIX domain-containing protein [Streptomyces sp. SID69]RAJ58701.1 8-oxo-dGTP diphosphatase [Streptomyces sp. PsTaAH-130]
MTGAPVRAAGCVLWRRSPSGTVELALVWRPKWSDWSWPKGKLKRGESAEAAALREVEEETGHTCRLGTALPTARYVDHAGRPKEVTYWAAESTGGTFTPNAEVTTLLWLPPPEAHTRLTHPHDRNLIGPALAAIATSLG